jgi:hypothetical protein
MKEDKATYCYEIKMLYRVTHAITLVFRYPTFYLAAAAAAAAFLALISAA